MICIGQRARSDAPTIAIDIADHTVRAERSSLAASAFAAVLVLPAISALSSRSLPQPLLTRLPGRKQSGNDGGCPGLGACGSCASRVDVGVRLLAETSFQILERWS